MKRIAWIGILLMLARAATAGDLLQWQDNSISYLYGDNFELDPETQQTLTFEHVSGWSMGDLFVFVDGIYWDGARDFKGDRATYYGEIAPRLSAGKILDKDLSVLFIKDFLLSGCYEFGKNSDENLLVGPAIDLNIPGFDFVQLNLYRRFDDMSSDSDSWQLTPVWKTTIPVGNTSIVFDGFIDWVFGDETRNLHICPQLKLDVGALVGMEAGTLYAGIEYDYWKNKYGVRDGSFGLDTDQNTFSALVKYHF
jgi:nucleoside-specific outer membrane channel protein Tsx